MAGRRVGWMLAVVWLLVPAGLAGAKEPGETTLASEGVATLRPRPTALRMEVELRAYGSTVKLALERLAARRQRALQTLEKLGADKGQIVLGPPEVVQLGPGGPSPGGSRVAGGPRGFLAIAPEATPRAVGAHPRPARVRPQARMVLAAEQTRGEGRLFAATRMLTADWPLAQTDLERLLVAAHDLQERIEAADVAGRPQELSAAERELLDEARRQQTDPELPAPRAGAAVEEPAGPDFLYVARITPQQRARLQSEAFAMARSRAASLAEVAGVRLSRLYDLSCQFEAATPADTYEAAEDGYTSEPPAGRLALLALSAGDETSGPILRSLRFTVLVTATFRLE